MADEFEYVKPQVAEFVSPYGQLTISVRHFSDDIVSVVLEGIIKERVESGKWNHHDSYGWSPKGDGWFVGNVTLWPKGEGK